MKHKIYIFIIIIFLFSQLSIIGEDIKTPDKPNDPYVANLDDDVNNKKEDNINIEFQYQNGKYNKGIIKDLSNSYLKLSWEGNEMGNQEILMSFVRSMRIKGYTMVKKKNDKLGMVFYFPHIFDIELKDGIIIKDAEGRVEEIESFLVYNSVGRQKCFTYFVRYWLEDKKVFSDNMSNDYYETPKVPDSVVIYLEFKN